MTELKDLQLMYSICQVPDIILLTLLTPPALLTYTPNTPSCLIVRVWKRRAYQKYSQHSQSVPSSVIERRNEIEITMLKKTVKSQRSWVILCNTFAEPVCFTALWLMSTCGVIALHFSICHKDVIVTSVQKVIKQKTIWGMFDKCRQLWHCGVVKQSHTWRSQAVSSWCTSVSFSSGRSSAGGRKAAGVAVLSVSTGKRQNHPLECGEHATPSWVIWIFRFVSIQNTLILKSLFSFICSWDVENDLRELLSELTYHNLGYSSTLNLVSS